MDGQNSTQTIVRWISVSIIVVSVVISGTIILVNYLDRSSGGGLGAPAAGNQPNIQQPAGPVKVSVDNDPVLGDQKAPLTLIEFSDFQCPYCRKFWKETFFQIKKEYIDTGKVKFVYRDFPLSFHPAAQPSAAAGECAFEQGKFWEMHDKIFEEQEKLGQGTVQFTSDDLKSWAKQAGLESAKFDGCLDSGEYGDEVNKDSLDGQAAGVSGTPTFFIGKSSEDGEIDGTKLVGAQPFSALKAAIDAQLK